MIAPDKTRQDWGARDPQTQRPEYEATSLEVHHTVGPDFDLWERIGNERSIRQIQDYHLDVKGWNDIFYNVVVTPDGITWEGRPVASDGVLKLVFIGNFHGEDTPTEDQQGVLMKYIDAFESVTWHAKRAAGTKYASACPGDDMISIIQDILSGDLTTTGESMTYEESQARIERLYVAILGRASDTPGRDFWAGEISSGRRTLTDILVEFLAVRLGADKAERDALTRSMGKASTGGLDASGVAAAAREVFYNELRVLAEAG